jgi:non-homologous end joining protein Ku
MAMIEARVAGEEVSTPETKRPAATNVVNLMDVLQRSLEQTKRGGVSARPKAVPAAKPAAKKAASAAKPKRKKSAA